MYNSNYGCGCGCNEGFGPVPCPAPIVAPKKVCVSQSRRYVEQPVICPIECRHVQNIVYYPRYYPRYEQTYMTVDSCGRPLAGEAQPFNTEASAG